MKKTLGAHSIPNAVEIFITSVCRYSSDMLYARSLGIFTHMLCFVAIGADINANKMLEKSK